jgi:hypothetical protein
MQQSSVTRVVLSSLFAFTIIGATVGRGADGTPPGATASDPSQGSTNGFLRNWFTMVGETQAEQPHWATPVATVTPRLEQEFRFDLSRQVQPDGTTVLENFDGSKGLEFIPQRHVEILINLPPYLARSEKRVPDGFGDVSFVMKYRILSANEQHGNYILAAFLGGSIPTGSYTNGTKEATITPTLAAGKGWGNFDAITTFGAILPIAETSLIGRQIVWNTTFQYRVLRKIWPEVEINSTFFSDGPNNGKKQAFVTPGFVLGKFPIWHRLGLTIGTGVQIAATQFHTYNHRYILTVRIPF